jgi:hypothetical protein
MEAIAICISNLKDKDGKYVRVYIGDDQEQHLDYCLQIAKLLKESAL